VDSIDDLRSELRRAGEAWIELLRPELQALRRGIVGDVATELRHASRGQSRRRIDPRKQAIVSLLEDNPALTNLEICRLMDKLQDKSADYAPLRSWKCRLWQDAYRCVPNRVHVYIGAIRRELTKQA
jgi:hypothetical protein